MIACSYLGSIFWAALVLIASLAAFHEFKFLCNNMGVYPIENWINFFITLFIMLPLLVVDHCTPEFIYTTSLTLIIAAYVIIFPRILLKNSYTRFEDVTVSLWAVFHFAMLPSFFTWIRVLDNGFLYTITIISAVAANDTASLFFGKIFGHKKLAPTISPGKTVAGSIGGLFFSAAIFLLLCVMFKFQLNEHFWNNKINYLQNQIPFFDLTTFTYLVIFILGLLFAIVAQTGDLLLSSLKRAAGVKDSGNILLSHGGVLDRIDSHFFAIWFAFFIFIYLLA